MRSQPTHKILQPINERSNQKTWHLSVKRTIAPYTSKKTTSSVLPKAKMENDPTGLHIGFHIECGT